MRYVCDTFAMRLRISLKYNYLQCISRGKKCLIWAENSEKCLCFYRENIVRKIANNRKIFLAIFCDAFAIVLRCFCDFFAMLLRLFCDCFAILLRLTQFARFITYAVYQWVGIVLIVVGRKCCLGNCAVICR